MTYERDTPHATIMTDLSFGDAGKGTTTEYLARHSTSVVVIRFNGGSQAEHNIITPDGKHHVFSQFGAGSFLPEVATHLSRDMLVNPINMEAEAQHLTTLGVSDIWERTTVDEDAKIVTPFHRAGNRLRELARGAHRHGSTGQGISEAVLDDMIHPEYTLYVRDILSRNLVTKLDAIRHYKQEQLRAFGSRLAEDTPDWAALNNSSTSDWYAEQYHEWADKLRIVPRDHLATLAMQYSHLLFEPAQGILLDEKRGFHPHTTWSNTTPDNARRQLAEIGYHSNVTTLGIVRAYTTRHGDGPFVTEDPLLDAPLYEYFNGTGPWQGHFRIGHFDAVAHRYAARAAGQLDGLVVTNVDRYDDMPVWQYASRYARPETADGENLYDFDRDGNVIDIKLGRYGDKLYQKRLTEQMFRARPLYEHIEHPTREEIVSTIEREIGIKAVLVSYGPTMNNKQVRSSEVIGAAAAV